MDKKKLVIITRDAKGSIVTARNIRSICGLDILIRPMLYIQPGPQLSAKYIANFDAVFATSGNALLCLNLNAKEAIKRAYMVASTPYKIGIKAPIFPYKNVKEMENAISANKFFKKPRSVLYLRGQHISKPLELPALHNLIQYIAYVAAEVHGLDFSDVCNDECIVLVYSKRSAELFAKKAHTLKQIGSSTCVAISENAAEPLRDTGFRRIIISESENEGGIIKALLSCL